MSTTSLLPHKPPQQLNNPTVYIRNNYYGSIGRPSSAGKRRSAVELLEESKAYYVKSEKVLDNKQEFKNADHLHVRSPTIEVNTMLRSPAPPIINGGGPFPFSMCLTCPPYPHQHFEHYDHYQIHQNVHNHHISSSQGSFLHHQQHQHHLNAPQGGGNSSGPPSVESGGTASTGSTGGGGVTAITTLGRSGKHYQSHHHHGSSHHHSKSHRSSSTGSSGSRHLQENLIEPILKTSTLGRTSKKVQSSGTLKHVSSGGTTRSKKDSSNVLATLLPGMSFTLPAQSSFQKSHHLHHHYLPQQSHRHHHPILIQQTKLSSKSGVLSLPPPPPPVTQPSHGNTGGNNTTGNGGRRSSSGGSSGATSSAAVASRSSLDKKRTLAPVTSTSTTSAQQKSGNLKPISIGSGHLRERNDDGSPPPLPPKSPRVKSKPARPHDFPQQLQLSVLDSSLESAGKSTDSRGGNTEAPPPPPRRQSQKDSSQKYLRLLQEQSQSKIPHSTVLDPSQSMTLPSPILPPTPPPDVVMESPMSDSGPIISPPPAFSTPVTPMVDRQNSSEKSTGAKPGVGNSTGRIRSLSQSTSHYHNITGFSLANTTVPAASISNTITANPTSGTAASKASHHYHVPLSGTVSMSAISSSVNTRRNSSGGNSARNNKSIPDLSTDHRYSPVSRSRSNSSPMSPESNPVSSPDDEEDADPTSSSVADNGHDGDDDCSEKGKKTTQKLGASGTARRNKPKSQPQITPNVTGKVTLIPKSVTENFLYKVSNVSATVGTSMGSEIVKTSSIAAQTEGKQEQRPKTTEAPSPARRPILRSKSDLSHRYAKAEKSGSLTPGFTLVHVDLGIPPQIPMHSSVSNNDFPGGAGNYKHFSHYHHPQQLHQQQHYHQPHHHHIYQTPISSKTLPSTVKLSSHYHEPHNSSHQGEKRATRSAGDLERFFDMLGMENSGPQPQSSSFVLSEYKEHAKAKTGGGHGGGHGGSDSPVFFSSVSSVDSAPRRSGSADSEDSPLDDKLGGKTGGAYGKFGGVGGSSIMVQHGEPSIVERNARVIKWLFNCRKAMDRR